MPKHNRSVYVIGAPHRRTLAPMIKILAKINPDGIMSIFTS